MGYDPWGSPARTDIVDSPEPLHAPGGPHGDPRADISAIDTAETPAARRHAPADESPARDARSISPSRRGVQALLWAVAAGCGALLLVVLALLGTHHLGGKTPVVQLYTVQTQTLSGAIGGGGTAQAAPDHEQNATLPAAGQVATVNVTVGQQVRAGQTLLTTQNGATVTALIAGTVAAVNVQPGGAYSANQVLVSVVDTSVFQVTAQFPIEDAGEVHLGQQAQVLPVQGSDMPFTGTIVGIDPALTSSSGSAFPVIIAVPNSSHRIIFVGQPVYASVAIQVQLPAVPEMAVLNATTEAVVFVYADGRAHLRHVVIGARAGDVFGIASGVQPGDQVIIVGQYQLYDGEQVMAGNV